MNTNQDYQDRPKPFSKERTRQTLCMIVYFYSVFFVVMKIISVFQGNRFLPHALIALPFVATAFWGYRMQRSKSFSWIYVILGIILISVVRYYEPEWLLYLENNL